MTTNGYTKTIKPVRDWTERIWRLMLGDQVEIARGRMEGAQPVAVTGVLTTAGAVTALGRRQSRALVMGSGTRCHITRSSTTGRLRSGSPPKHSG